MIKRGVRVFSVANLHAKVFVLGRAAFIGSANVCKRSADSRIGAAVRLSEAGNKNLENGVK
jgi:phosphatidylserine/phosphatidylglycerophosphate/cardiolipin synthase-like enzyme